MISAALHSEVPQYSALPAATMSCIAWTTSSVGVSGSAAVTEHEVDVVEAEPLQ